ncbi:MAG TPA: DNA-formamidopyrimidine glycosylase family protein [Anaerolineae bacterium]|nr:DNA-formamidopyrimidine glycosylase family protein [Anaerolineae bacterium]
MPELPEITVMARDMRKELVGRTFGEVEVLQPKCLNVPVADFQTALRGAEIRDVTPRGKWVRVELSDGWLLLCLGMGGEILLTDRDHLPEKRRLIFDLADGAAIAVNFWWFGYAHTTPTLAAHKMTAELGPDMMDLSLEDFRALLGKRKGAIKTLLLDQKHIAGIGNVYVQDPLFLARIHPLRSIASLSDAEIAALWTALRETLQQSIDQGGSAWEQNLYGVKGQWDQRFMHILHLEGQPCPVCGTIIENIKTGSTHTRVCPVCQPLSTD